MYEGINSQSAETVDAYTARVAADSHAQWLANFAMKNNLSAFGHGNIGEMMETTRDARFNQIAAYGVDSKSYDSLPPAIMPDDLTRELSDLIAGSIRPLHIGEVIIQIFGRNINPQDYEHLLDYAQSLQSQGVISYCGNGYLFKQGEWKIQKELSPKKSAITKKLEEKVTVVKAEAPKAPSLDDMLGGLSFITRKEKERRARARDGKKQRIDWQNLGY